MNVLKHYLKFFFLNYFIFQNYFFIQRRGVVMGSAFAPSFANLYMASFEEKFV